MAAITEKRFEYKGYPCVVLMQDGAYRTGYVGLPATHKYYSKHYSRIPQEIYCHGGLTYSSNRLIGQEDENIWWIGFDCCHHGDARDFDSALELFKNDDKTISWLNHLMESGEYMNEYWSVCTLEYCESQCMRIVDQIDE